MRNPHPSWPTPLLAMGPIRLRPMGWLDDLLPLRPPSLWSGKSLYARSLRWQPDTADLSWLFDAYAMLGIELPPPRIEHRSHQRTQRRGVGRSGRQQLRRQRAPIKGGKRPLVVPQWSKPQAMRGPSQSPTGRIETTSPTKSVSLARQRSSGGLPNVPNFQWRSPQSAEGGSGRVSPNLLSAPTFLQGVSPEVAESQSVSTRKQSQQEFDEGVRETKNNLRAVEPSVQRRVSRPDAPEWKRPQSTTPQASVLGVSPSTLLKKEGTDSNPEGTISTGRSQSNVILPHQRATTKSLGSSASNESVSMSPRAQRVPASRLPPKVTWKPTHQQSPWRLHPSDRSTVARSTEASVSEEVRQQRTSQRSLVAIKSSVETRWQLPLGIQAPPETRSWTKDAFVELRADIPVQKTGAVDEKISTPARVQTVSLRDTKGQRWRLQHSASTAKPSMVLQPLATVQRQFLDLSSVSDVPVEQTTRSKSTSSVQAPSVEKKSTTRVVNTTPEHQPTSSLIEPHKSVTRPSIRTSTVRSVDRSPPLINWRPSIQPVRWRLLRTGESDTTMVPSAKAVRIAPPKTQRPSAQLIVPTSEGGESSTPRREPLKEEDPRSLRSTESSESVETVSKSTTSKKWTDTQQGLKSVTGSVQIPSRVPWRLTPTNRTSLRLIQQGGVVSQSVVANNAFAPSEALRPSSQRVARDSISRTLPPKITSWHPPKRKELIEHFRQPRLQAPVLETSIKSRSRSESVNETATVVPTYSFASAEGRSLFRAQEQSMVMPLQAGTMVFPTPEVDGSSTSIKTRPPVELDDSTKARRDVTTSEVDASPVKQGIESNPERLTQSATPTRQTTQRIPSKGKYPPAYVQSRSGYQRRTVGSALSLVERAIRRLEVKENNDSIRSVLSSVRTQIAQPRWRLPQVFIQNRTSVQARDVSKNSRSIVRPTWTTAPQWTPQQNIRTQLLIPSDLSDRPESRSTRVANSQDVSSSKVVVSNIQSPPTRERVRDVSGSSKTSKKRTMSTLRQDVEWQRSSLVISPPNRNQRKNPTEPKKSTIEQPVAQRSESVQRIQQVSWRLPPRFKDPFVSGSSLSGTASSAGSPRRTVTMQSSGLSPSLVYQPIAEKAVQDEASPRSRSEADAVEYVDIQEVVQHVERQVRRLPKSQRALLRSQIALPTQWLSQMGGATTQTIRNVLRSQQDVFVTKPENIAEESSVVVTGEKPRQIRSLSTSQINRIVERQVEFFRSAQRQSFLRGSQMGGGTGGIPSPARSGLQSVTQEMRTALQRMVLSTSQEQILLDAVEQGVEQEIRRQNQKVQRDAPAKQKVPRSFTGLSKSRIRPSWRPNLHTVQPSNRPSAPSTVAPSQSETYLDAKNVEPASDPNSQVSSTSSASSNARSRPQRGRTPGMVQPMRMMGKSDIGTFVRPKKPPTPEEVSGLPQSTKQDPTTIDRQSEVFMIDPSGKLLTGEAATKRLTEMGFARSESTKPKETSTASSGSYTWEAPPDVMDEMMQQVRQQLASEQTQEEQVLQRRKTSPPRQSMIQEWTEEQLLSILVELSSDSPEANALLRDVQERVEEYFDLERFRRI